jgi:hypothetical protein
MPSGAFHERSSPAAASSCRRRIASECLTTDTAAIERLQRDEWEFSEVAGELRAYQIEKARCAAGARQTADADHPL